MRLTARPIFKIVLPLAVALAAVAGPCKASHIGVFTNWDYEIGHGAFTTREQDALLRYAAGQCEPVRRVSSQGTIAKVPLKSKPGPLSHITLELFSIPSTPNNLVRRLENEGVLSICYFSGGSLNTDRPEDKPWVSTFDRLGLLGPPVRKFSKEYRSECFEKHANSSLSDKIRDSHCYWDDNRWLLPSDGPEMRSYFQTRIAMCKERGFAGVEADNMDAASQAELRGRTSTEAGIKMISMLADLCRQNDISCGLKNAGTVARQFANDFDFGIVERCLQFHECQLYSDFKTVLEIEYDNHEIPSGPNILAVKRGESEMKEIVGLITRQCTLPEQQVVHPANGTTAND